MVTNEPSRPGCGVPDFSITVFQLPQNLTCVLIGDIEDWDAMRGDDMDKGLHSLIGNKQRNDGTSDTFYGRIKRRRKSDVLMRGLRSSNAPIARKG